MTKHIVAWVSYEDLYSRTFDDESEAWRFLEEDRAEDKALLFTIKSPLSCEFTVTTEDRT